MRRPSLAARPLVAIALCSGVAIGAIAFARVTDMSGPGARADPELRRELLAPLAHRVVAAADGGWVLSTPTDAPEPDRRLLAAAVLATDPTGGRPIGPSDVTPVAAALEGPEARRHALALAQAMAMARSDAAVPAATAHDVERRTYAGLDRGDGAWLAPLLHLVRAPGDIGVRARRRLETYAPSASCKDLPGSGDPLPAPGGALVLLLRVLVARSERCPEADPLLRRALDHETWAAPIAADEIADLVALGGGRTGDAAALLDQRFATWTEPPDRAPTDLAVLVLVRRAQQVAARPAPLPRSVALRMRTQIAADGRMADRSTTPTSPFDVAILRQLAHDDLIPGWVADEAAEVATAAAPEAEWEATHALFVARRAPECDATPSTVGRPASIVREVDRSIHSMTAARCRGELDRAALLAELASGRIDPERMPAAWAAIASACILDPDVVTDDAAATPSLDGSLADESLWIASAAVLADPVAACAAERS